MRRRIFALIALLGIPPQAASGQADVTLSNDTRIFLHGELTSSHARSNHGHYDGGYHQHYFYSGTSGDSVWVTTVSPPPQPVRVAVAIFAPGGSTFLADDGGRFVDPFNEGRPSWYASVESRLPSTGQYVICVHTHDGAGTGSYALSVSTYGAPPGAPSPSGATPGAMPNYPRAYARTTYTGRLESGDHRLEGKYHDDWLYRGRAGERVVITMDAHGNAFDPELFLYRGWSGLDADIIACDADGGEGANARVEAVLPADGEYVILAAARHAGAAGAYTLRVNGSGARGTTSRASGCAPGTNTTTGPPPTASATGSQYPFTATPTVLFHLQRGRFQPEDARTPDGQYYDVWLHEADETGRHAIHVSSDEVDTELELYAVTSLARGDITLLARDDDSGAGSSACVEMTLNAGTTYLLVARARLPNATGTYRAQITSPGVRGCGD